jgi:GTP-binding protein
MNTRYFSATYLKNAPTIAEAPPDTGGEVAFAGRSNAGKSSALNAITNQKGLARTSKTPGRTQHLVFFKIDDDIRLVDLPGYGYAKVPESVKRHWQTALEDYLTHRRSLLGLILLMDIRHPLKEFDRQMLMWSYECGLPVHVLLTKADKLKSGAAKNQLLKVKEEIDHEFPNTSIQIFSVPGKIGVDEVHEVLDEWYSSRSNPDE